MISKLSVPKSKLPIKLPYIIIICVFSGLLFCRTYFTFPPSNVIFSDNSNKDQKIEINRTIPYSGKKRLPWYYTMGDLLPDEKSTMPIWPDELHTDRIHEQLMTTAKSDPGLIKTIYAKQYDFGLPLGDSLFKDCPVDRCTLIASREKADAVLFYNLVQISRQNVPQEQIWILCLRESPVHTRYGPWQNSAINWTATYRSDSELPFLYGKWMYYDDEIQEDKNLSRIINYAAGKTRSVAWFVSNCRAKSRRLEYAMELQKYIDVDIYGNCGNLKCSRSDEKDCFELLRSKYKFYLAFENSYCREYITEKLFVNALSNDVVPVVMGAHPDDYKRSAPKNSYIHVDDFGSAKELAEYLKYLSENDDKYNDYFAWKGTGQLINSRLYCRLCALLHNPTSPRYYADFKKWWAADGICRNDAWT